MSKRSKKLLNRIEKADTIVNKASEALIKLLEHDRDNLGGDLDLSKVRQGMIHQMKLYIESLMQSLETVEAAEGHARENLETRQDIIHARAAKLTLLASFDEALLANDPEFSQQFLDNVEKEAFQGGADGIDRERLLEVHRWINEVINE